MEIGLSTWNLGTNAKFLDFAGNTVLINYTTTIGFSTVASTITAGSLAIQWSGITDYYVTSGTSSASARFSRFLTNNATTVIGGSGTNIFENCRFTTGTATSLTINDPTTLIDCNFNSSNSSVIDGTSTISYAGLTFDNSSEITTTSQAVLYEGPSRTLGASSVGLTNQMIVLNEDNTNGASHARAYLQTGGASGGDPSIRYTISGVRNWAHGVDNSDDDAFVLSPADTLGSSNVMHVTTSGEINYPFQPGFLAIAASQANVTGDNTTYTVQFTNEIFDQNGDFDGTSTFTAPVTGRYQLNVFVNFAELGAANGLGSIRFVTSNRTLICVSNICGAIRNSANGLIEGASMIFDMDAGDTATVNCNVAGGTKIVDIETNSAFSGWLLG